MPFTCNEQLAMKQFAQRHKNMWSRRTRRHLLPHLTHFHLIVTYKVPTHFFSVGLWKTTVPQKQNSVPWDLPHPASDPTYCRKYEAIDQSQHGIVPCLFLKGHHQSWPKKRIKLRIIKGSHQQMMLLMRFHSLCQLRPIQHLMLQKSIRNRLKSHLSRAVLWSDNLYYDVY